MNVDSSIRVLVKCLDTKVPGPIGLHSCRIDEIVLNYMPFGVIDCDIREGVLSIARRVRLKFRKCKLVHQQRVGYIRASCYSFEGWLADPQEFRRCRVRVEKRVSPLPDSVAALAVVGGQSGSVV